MLNKAIRETVPILDKHIKLNQYKIVALTNWSHETFPIALNKFEFLH
jgi:2-haloacid dehalogenase